MREQLSPDAKIVSIGGGSMNTAKELLKYGLDMSGKSKPSVLLVPTPKVTEEKSTKSTDAARRIYQDELGLPFEVLHGGSEGDTSHWSDDELENKILGADVFYISGGNTRHAVQVWIRHGIDKKMVRALNLGAVSTGSSAGASKWVDNLYTDSDSYSSVEGSPWDYGLTPGIGAVFGTINPHHSDTSKSPLDQNTQSSILRCDRFYREISTHALSSHRYIGVDSNAALVMHDGSAEVIASRDNAGVELSCQSEEGLLVQKLNESDGAFTFDLIQTPTA